MIELAAMHLWTQDDYATLAEHTLFFSYSSFLNRNMPHDFAFRGVWTNLDVTDTAEPPITAWVAETPADLQQRRRTIAEAKHVSYKQLVDALQWSPSYSDSDLDIIHCYEYILHGTSRSMVDMQYVILDHPQELSPAMVEGIFKLSPAQVGEKIQQFYCGQACHLNRNWLPKQTRPAQQSWCGENAWSTCGIRKHRVGNHHASSSSMTTTAKPVREARRRGRRIGWKQRCCGLVGERVHRLPQDRHRLNWWLSTGRSSNARTDRYHSEEQWLWTLTHGQ